MRRCDAIFAARAEHRRSHYENHRQLPLTERIELIFDQSQGISCDNYDRVTSSLLDLLAENEDATIRALAPEIEALIDSHRPLHHHADPDLFYQQLTSDRAISALHQDLRQLLDQSHLS